MILQCTMCSMLEGLGKIHSTAGGKFASAVRPAQKLDPPPFPGGVERDRKPRRSGTGNHPVTSSKRVKQSPLSIWHAVQLQREVHSVWETSVQSRHQRTRKLIFCHKSGAECKEHLAVRHGESQRFQLRSSWCIWSKRRAQPVIQMLLRFVLCI